MVFWLVLRWPHTGYLQFTSLPFFGFEICQSICTLYCEEVLLFGLRNIHFLALNWFFCPGASVLTVYTFDAFISAYFSVPLRDLHCLARFHSSMFLSGTRKRRQRRQRAAARAAWYNHCTGKVPLSSWALLQIKRTLASHHTKDQNFIRKIQQHINMDPGLYRWRCSKWQRINKKIAVKCVICKSHWTTGTRHRTEPHAQPYQSDWPKDRHYDWQNWESEDQSWQWPMTKSRSQSMHSEQSHAGSQSPRTFKGSQSPRGQKGKDKGKGKAKGKHSEDPTHLAGDTSVSPFQPLASELALGLLRRPRLPMQLPRHPHLPQPARLPVHPAIPGAVPGPDSFQMSEMRIGPALSGLLIFLGAWNLCVWEKYDRFFLAPSCSVSHLRASPPWRSTEGQASLNTPENQMMRMPLVSGDFQYYK